MNDPSQFDRDDELLARLRAADPAAALPPADPARVARLLEETMSNETETGTSTETTPSRETGTRNRGPLTWLVAAAAVLLIAGVGIFGLLQHDAGTTPPPTAGNQPTVTQLQAPPAGAAGKCMVPNAAVLGGMDTAFSGTVTAMASGLVTLHVDHWYAGTPTDSVQVAAPAATDLQALIGAVEFHEGGRYLVSSRDGRVAVCGMSAPYGADLAALYARAFPQ